MIYIYIYIYDDDDNDDNDFWYDTHVEIYIHTKKNQKSANIYIHGEISTYTLDSYDYY